MIDALFEHRDAVFEPGPEDMVKQGSLESIQLRVSNRSDRLARLIALKAPQLIIDNEKNLLEQSFIMLREHFGMQGSL